MTLSKQLKMYITERFQLNYQETWACETVDAVAEDVLPEKYIKNSPLEHKILNTFTYYNDELHEISIYPFLCYLDKELVAIGYLDNFDLDFIFLNDTHQIIIDERYLLQKGDK
ncbi:SAUGI family uracil-DNA glycosylase inhibitor [Staphylococcus aureus]|uniref:SAUGI family uracil-DNA glycosylase inhibitor n=1 Tax=Staphylococcus aureus TaxID=1280 RepID=UPI000DE1E404|nr:SAUGI family uracil-DNA glycosylase inhibitor [Staphylococcus aureus]